jgi:hypothetical protein
MFRVILVVLLLAMVSPVHGGEADLSGSVAMQARLFWNDPAWAGQNDEALLGSIISELEFGWYDESGRQRVSVVPMLRWDGQDAQRNLFDLQEAFWALEGDAYELLIGANTVFWGVTESVHLVDIINQTDFAGDIDGENKLGQPMVSLTLQRDWGELAAFVLPLFRERTFAGNNGRFRLPLPVDAGRAVYESSDGDRHVDLALRYSHYIGDADVGLSLFSGTNREPRLVPAADGQALVPHYDQIRQFGVDLQYTKDAWLWKLEAFARDGQAGWYTAAVAGFEYTLYQVGESAADLGILLEVQYDGRGQSEPVTLADNDVFVGTRLALNDVQDTAVLAGFAYDVDTDEILLTIEAERRIGENWFVELRARDFSGSEPGDSGYWLQRDGYVEVEFARFF